MESLWEEMKDVVIKTLLISHKGTISKKSFQDVILIITKVYDLTL